MNLASDIKELILLNEGVILPGLGGFVTNYHPAEIHKESHLFQPPSMKLSFDNRMVTDNGLLISHIARKNKFSEDEARLKVNEYIEELKKVLHEKGTFLIEDVGTISKSPDGELTFNVFDEINYRIDSFGLPPIEVPHPAKQFETKPRTIPLQEVPVVTQKKKKIPVAALIAFFIILSAGVVYFTGIFDRFVKPLFLADETASENNVTDSNKIIFGQTVTADEDTIAAEVNQQLTEKTSKEKALYYEESAKPVPKQTEIQTRPAEPPTAAPPVTRPGNYFIVAGSFLKPGNADRQKANLEKKGYMPRIVRKNDNFFYVTLQSFDNKESAKAEMKILARELDIPMWVMQK